MKTYYTAQREKAEIAKLEFRLLGPWTCRQERGTSISVLIHSREEEEEDAQNRPCGKAKKVEWTLWENVKRTRRNGIR